MAVASTVTAECQVHLQVTSFCGVRSSVGAGLTPNFVRFNLARSHSLLIRTMTSPLSVRNNNPGLAAHRHFLGR